MSKKKTISLQKSVNLLDTQDRIVEGLRIPALLDAQHTVNFVLTQEPGKLKPKDLKIAIEKNRAEREARAEEQRKLREEGGGAGVLDLRGILAEERLNYTPGDAFRRQLREIAFLADVEEVEKQEAEKVFRVSEDYIGSNILSAKDIELIKQQRTLAQHYAIKQQWRKTQNRQHSIAFSPISSVRAGVLQSTAQTLVSTLKPSFDPNRNDIWSKRLNTLRKFIYLVSKWIIRRRIKLRMKKIMDNFHSNNAYTREEIRAYIEQENIEYKLNSLATASSSSSSASKTKSELAAFDPTADKRSMTLAELVFAEENMVITKRQHHEQIISSFQYAVKHGEAEFTISMAKRACIPSFERDLLKKDNNSQGGQGNEVIKNLLMQKMTFDDRSFVYCKVKPHYITQSYTTGSYPKLPIYYPMGKDKDIRLEAPEEQCTRPAADSSVSSKLLLPFYSSTNEPEELQQIRKDSAENLYLQVNSQLFPMLDEHNNINHKARQDRQQKAGGEDSLLESLIEAQSFAPSWLESDEITYSIVDLELNKPRPDFRSYKPLLPYVESDAFFPLRPHEDHMVDYIADSSLRTQYTLLKGGFRACNQYLLGGLESDIHLTHPHVVNPNLPNPPSHTANSVNYSLIPDIGPIFSDYYTADTDRHISGLICYANDTDRTLLQWDQDVAPLQSKQAKEDVLTDSDSDDEDCYVQEKPSMALVRKLLTAPVIKEEPKDPKDKKKGDKKDEKKDAKAPAAPIPASPGVGEEDMLLNENERREEQVELLRDRKLLDYASTIQKQHKKHLEQVHQTNVNVASKTIPIYSLPVAVPFHMYEEEVYQHMSKYVPERSQVLVELDPHQMMLSQPPTSMSVTSLPPFSPSKYK